MNGGSTFATSGDDLEFSIASEKTDPAVLVRQ